MTLQSRLNRLRTFDCLVPSPRYSGERVRERGVLEWMLNSTLGPLSLTLSPEAGARGQNSRTCAVVLIARSLSLMIMVASLMALTAYADEPLYSRIDALVEAKLEGQPVASTTDDAEFLRRVFLDLTGRVPATADAREFLNDSAADKRVKLIDRLLASSEFPRRMTDVMNVLLMERRGEHPEWLAYLRTSFEQNKPWDVMAREMISPDPKNEQTRAAAFFLSKRLENYGQNPVDYPILTRDVGRLMLGMDLQCAQCHDHLFIKDYKQADFQGMYVVFLNASLRSDAKFPAVAEKLLTKKIEFQSVFNTDKKEIGPRVPGREEIAIPTFAKGEEFAEPPDPKAKTPGRLKFSPLEHLANQITSPDNPAFARNIANRVWFQLMGRGLVHPLDQHHSENPPSHPELLDLLARELVEHKFDLKWLIRELALTRTYQRSSLLPADTTDPLLERYIVALEKPLSAEQLFWSVLFATGQIDSAPAAQPATATASAESKPDTTEADKAAKPQSTTTRFEPLKQKFLKAFANPPMEPEGEFAPSLRAALFLMNDSELLKLLDPQPSNLLTRLKSLDSAEQIADELYLSVLSRRPAVEEVVDLADQLKIAGERKELALKHLAWALLASTEFCVNH